MNNQKLMEFNKGRKINQIAIVTPDLEQSMKAWVENLGIGPWIVVTVTENTLEYLKINEVKTDEPFKFLIAVAQVGDIQFEMIQPVYGPTIFEKFVQEKGEGLHHIKEKIATENIDSVISSYKRKGISVIQDGKLGDDLHFYLDTQQSLGFLYEIGNSPELDLPPEMYRIYPSEEA